MCPKDGESTCSQNTGRQVESNGLVDTKSFHVISWNNLKEKFSSLSLEKHSKAVFISILCQGDSFNNIEVQALGRQVKDW